MCVIENRDNEKKISRNLCRLRKNIEINEAKYLQVAFINCILVQKIMLSHILSLCKMFQQLCMSFSCSCYMSSLCFSHITEDAEFNQKFEQFKPTAVTSVYRMYGYSYQQPICQVSEDVISPWCHLSMSAEWRSGTRCEGQILMPSLFGTFDWFETCRESDQTTSFP